MSVIAIALVTVVIIFLIQYFMDKEDEPGVFDDYISITAEDLKNLTGYDANSGVYGDFTYFAGKDEYEDLFDLINANDKIYIYFYNSTDLNDDIVDAIKDKNLEGKAFFLVDLSTEASKLSTADYEHLNLDLERNNLFVTFDVENQEFETEIRTVDILRVIGKL